MHALFFICSKRTWTELNKWVCAVLTAAPAATAIIVVVVVVVILSARLLHHCSKWIFAYPRFFTEPFWVLRLVFFFSPFFRPNAMGMSSFRQTVDHGDHGGKSGTRKSRKTNRRQTNESNAAAVFTALSFWSFCWRFLRRFFHFEQKKINNFLSSAKRELWSFEPDSKHICK